MAATTEVVPALSWAPSPPSPKVDAPADTASMIETVSAKANVKVDESQAKQSEVVPVAGQEEEGQPQTKVEEEDNPEDPPAASAAVEKKAAQEKKALEELRARVEEAILKKEFAEPPPEKPAAPEEQQAENNEDKAEQAKKQDKDTAKGEILERKKEENEEEKKPANVDDKARVAEAGATAKEPKATTTTKTTEEKSQTAEERFEKIGNNNNKDKGEELRAEPSASCAAAVAEREGEGEGEGEEIQLWGVPLQPSKGDERTDVVLMKFLRARDFNVAAAFTMIKQTVLWRRRFGADALLHENVDADELQGVAFMHGFDREGHPVCYNVYSVFQDKRVYDDTFGDEQKRQKFVRWRVRLLEKGIHQYLSFNPGEISSMVQITDLNNAPAVIAWNVIRPGTKHAVSLLQDNYPEFVSTKIFINVPWWYLALNTMISPFVSQRTKRKFVIARPAKVQEALFKYIAPQHVPVQYGGLSRGDNDPDFKPADQGVSEATIKGGAKHTLEIQATHAGSTLVWELTVVGWEATYEAEFVPSRDGEYTILIHKSRSVMPNPNACAYPEPIRQSYTAAQPGKLVLTLHNNSSKKKTLLFRYKVVN